MNRSGECGADTPSGDCTVTSTVAAGSPPGATAVIVPSAFAVNDCAATLPKNTPVAAERFTPKIVTESPPLEYPLGVFRAVTIGTDVLNVNWSAEPAAEVPAVVVTATSTVPRAWP